jgi:TonB family protein
VPLDHYKTQVLLLHSEQSTLDSLSSGFGDRYTVHYATSGSEALNTLVETPINVIISAQDLPGMSGLEALREAKKRSPETVGILLAGSANQGLEALVGDEEVFQVVRGNVSTESLRKMVDNATQQVRLMALAESANDTAADVDEPAEHIVMETSENGSTIISDGTGRMPALNPEKISAATAAGSRYIDVLVFTKDHEFLATIKESSRGMHTVHYANTLAQADEIIRTHKVGVAVLDAAMVTEKIERLIQYLRQGSSRLVSIVAGRRDDGEMLMDLINRGNVYRFLLKPVSPGRARLAVEASVKHHLEAPDATFKIKGTPAARKPAPKPAPATRAMPQSSPATAPATKANPIPNPLAPKPKVIPEPLPEDPPLGEPRNESPIDRGLSSALGDDDTSFAETITGLVSSFIKNRKESEAPAPEFPKRVATPPKLAALSDGAREYIVRNAKVIGIAAATIIVLASVLFWFTGSDDEADLIEDSLVTSTPSVTEEDVVFDTPVNAGNDAQPLVDEARLARGAGQIFNPAGSNAIELYLAAVAADPSNAAVAAELDTVIEQALGMAESAVLDTRLDDAAAALQRVALADADNPRLPFLAAQLAQMQLRSHLADARAAIRDTRFEDAGNAIAAARALAVADTTEVDAVAEEFDSARSEQQVDEVLALANARFEEGDLLSPANDNARYYYDLVLTNDPGNAAARQGLSVIASTLVLQARTEIDGGRLDNAEQLLNNARAIDASSSELAATDTALVGARDAIIMQEQRRAAEARRQAEAERQAAEKARLERQRLAEEDAQAAAVEKAPKETTEETVGESVSTDSGDAATQDDESVTDAMAAETLDEPVSADVLSEKPVAISSLTRTKYYAPKYPRVAQRRNLSGWVSIEFTVALDGSVRDVEVRDSEPVEVFDNAAIRAVEKWKFEPILENGVAVEKRAGVRMMFALE